MCSHVLCTRGLATPSWRNVQRISALRFVRCNDPQGVKHHSTRLYLGKLFRKIFRPWDLFFIVRYPQTVECKFYYFFLTYMSQYSSRSFVENSNEDLYSAFKVTFCIRFDGRKAIYYTNILALDKFKVSVHTRYSVFLYRTKLWAIWRCGKNNEQNNAEAITPKVKYKFVNKKRSAKTKSIYFIISIFTVDLRYTLCSMCYV